jgi:hypothetical protein
VTTFVVADFSAAEVVTVGFGYVPPRSPPAEPLGTRESDRRESLPTQAVVLLVPKDTFRVTAPDVPPPVNAVPAVTEVMSPPEPFSGPPSSQTLLAFLKYRLSIVPPTIAMSPITPDAFVNVPMLAKNQICVGPVPVSVAQPIA